MKEEPRFKQTWYLCVESKLLFLFTTTTPGEVESELIRLFYVKRLNINLVKMSKSHLAMILNGETGRFSIAAVMSAPLRTDDVRTQKDSKTRLLWFISFKPVN